jgi:hypothetical protein
MRTMSDPPATAGSAAASAGNATTTLKITPLACRRIPATPAGFPASIVVARPCAKRNWTFHIRMAPAWRQ